MQYNARIDLRLSHEKKESLERAAHLGGYRSLSDFIISAAEQSAKSILDDSLFVELSKADAAVFCSMLLEDRQPNEELNAAIERSAKLLQWKRK
jgi:uncharacterized protein (DUF1778 family)